MAEIIKLFELEIDLEKATADTRATKIAIEQLKEESQRLKESEGELSDAYLESQASLKVLQKELRQNESITQNVIQANEANTGSIEQMRRQLAVVSVQWAKLSKDERENTVEGQKLTAQKKQLTEALKKEERATGDARRNVGNYNEVLGQSVGIFGQFVPAVGQAGGAISSLGKLFTVALGPIGLVLAAVGAVVAGLKAFFTSSEEGQDAWAQFGAAGSQVLANLTDGLSLFGKALTGDKGAFEQIKDFFDSTFVRSLKGTFETLVNSVKLFFNGINLQYQRFKNLFTDNAEGIKAAQKDIEENQKAITKGIQESIGGLNTLIGKVFMGVQAAQALAQRQSLLDKAIRASLVQNAKDAERVAKLRNEVAQKEAFTEQQRLKRLEEAIKLEQQILARNLEIAQQKYNIQKAQNALSNSTKEDLDKEAQLLADIYNVRRANFEKTKELEGQRAELALKIRAEEEKAIADQRNKELAGINNIVEQTEANLKAELESVKALEAQKATLREQAAQARAIELDAEYEANKANVFRTLELEAQKLELQRQQEIAFAEKIGADTTFINQKYANAEIEIERAKQDAKAALLEGFAGNLKTIFGEQTAIGKAAAVAETTVNTYRGATAAYTALAGIPVVGPALGIAAAAAAVAAGLANVKKILSVKSGLPGDNASAPGISANTGAGGATSAALAAPTVNQGIISRETVTQNSAQNLPQGILVVDQVTAAQTKQSSNAKTGVI